MLFRNLDGGRFEQIGTDLAGSAIEQRHSSRGAAAGKIDKDGGFDPLIWTRNEVPTSLRNDMPASRNWLSVTAPMNTRVTVIYGKYRQAREVMSQASFYSCNDPRLHFELGPQRSWNWRFVGRMEKLSGVPA